MFRPVTLLEVLGVPEEWDGAALGGFPRIEGIGT